MQITRRLEFDAGHRIPDHASQCRHLHGHRYALEVTLAGSVICQPNDPANGMVMDFGRIKEIAREQLVDHWDHAFLAFSGDTQLTELLAAIPGHKTVLLNAVPTVENLALEAFKILEPVYVHAYSNRLSLARIRLFETPNCWADVDRRSLQD